MSFAAKASTVKQLLVPAGKLYVDVIVNGVLTGERYLGETDSFNVNIAGEKIEEYSMENGLKVLADSILIGVTRTATMTVKQVSRENLALFLAAVYGVQVQAAGDVDAEAHTVLPDRYYQLGRSDDNPSGVRDISTVTVVAGVAAIAWTDTAAKALGAKVKPTTTPTYYWQCTTAGTTAGTEPTWVATPGATITDGTVVWTCMGILAPVLATDYTVDATLGRVYVTAAARVHPTLGTAWAVDYTKAAREREQIKTTGSIDATAALRLVANNVRGDQRDWYMPKCSLTPSGDFPLKTDDPTYVALPFEVGILKPDDGAAGQDIAAIYMDGRAVA